MSRELIYPEALPLLLLLKIVDETLNKGKQLFVWDDKKDVASEQDEILKNRFLKLAEISGDRNELEPLIDIVTKIKPLPKVVELWQEQTVTDDIKTTSSLFAILDVLPQQYYGSRKIRGVYLINPELVELVRVFVPQTFNGEWWLEAQSDFLDLLKSVERGQPILAWKRSQQPATKALLKFLYRDVKIVNRNFLEALNLRQPQTSMFDDKQQPIETDLVETALVVLQPPLDFSVPNLVEGTDVDLRRLNAERQLLYLKGAEVLLREGGVLLALLPERVLSGSSYSELRSWILNQFEILAIVSLERTQKVFYGAGPFYNLMCLQKKSRNAKKEDYPIFMGEVDLNGDNSKQEIAELQEAYARFLKGEKL